MLNETKLNEQLRNVNDNLFNEQSSDSGNTFQKVKSGPKIQPNPNLTPSDEVNYSECNKVKINSNDTK